MTRAERAGIGPLDLVEFGFAEMAVGCALRKARARSHACAQWRQSNNRSHPSRPSARSVARLRSMIASGSG